MNSIMGVVVVLIVLNILFLVTGKSFFCLFKREETIEFEWLTGFVLFLAVFGVIELPIEMSGLPFHVLVYAESAVFAVLLQVVSCIVYMRVIIMECYCGRNLTDVLRCFW